MIRTLFKPCNYWILIAFFLLSSCMSAKKVSEQYVYFQKGLDSLGRARYSEITIQPNDQISIFVFSKSLNQEQAAVFNMASGQSASSSSAAGPAASSTGSAGTAQGYIVGPDGRIEMPILGLIKASGLTRFGLQNEIRELLLPYVKDPAVVVRFLDFKVNVLGEVKSPGPKSFNSEKVTILDAIGACGDLTDVGKREDVTVIREERDGQRNIYTVDLRSGALFQSPVFQLQQNDIVYVQPNKNKLKTLKSKPDLSSFQLGMSLLSIVSTMFLLFKRL